MNIDYLGLFDTISKSLNNRNALANNLSKSFNNKKLNFTKYFIWYLFVIFFMIANILILFKNDLLDQFITNDQIKLIIKSIIIAFDAVPLFFFVGKILNIDHYFCTDFHRIKKSLYEKSNKFFYLKTKSEHKKFKLKRIKSYCIESILPICIIVLCCLTLLFNYSLHYLIMSLILIILSSFVIANHYDKYYSLEFYVSNTFKKTPYELIKGREVININGQTFLISNKERNALYYMNDVYLEIKYRASLFEKEEVHLYITYLTEFIALLQDFRKDKSCTNKGEVDSLISEGNAIIDKLKELL